MNEEKRKAWCAEYRATMFHNPVKRARSIANLDEAMRRRLDQLLFHSEVPIATIAQRFDLRPKMLHRYMKEHGVGVGFIDRVSNTQPRRALNAAKHSRV